MFQCSVDTIEQLERNYARVKHALDKRNSVNNELNAQIMTLQKEHTKVIAIRLFVPAARHV